MKIRYKTLALLALCPLLALAQDETDADTDGEAEAAPTSGPELTGTPEEQYATLLRRNQALRTNNALREQQIAAQERDLANVEAAMGGVGELEVQLPPLLISMVDGLEEFIDEDVPFLLDNRRDELTRLRTLVRNAEVSDAQKLRRILEAWMIEREYGGARNVYRDEIALPDGTERPADFLQLGRIALIYQTIDDEAATGAYDYRTGEWVELGSAHRSSVRQAIQMGRNQIAPDLVLLPTVPPQTD